MRKILAVALAALAAACASDKKEEPIQYGAPLAPTPTEQSALASAGTTLQSSLAYQASAEPTAGAAGLGDQLVANLGGYAVATKMPDASSAKLAQRAMRQAFDTGGMDPACVTTAQAGGVTTVSWGMVPGVPCHVEVSSVDPYSGDTMAMTVDVTGTLTWDPAHGSTSWNIGEGYTLDMTSGGERITAEGTAALVGSLTVGASTITASTSSAIDMTTHYMGLTIPEGLVTTLSATLGYQADPFCITSGSLTVEQRWTKRPMGATQDSLPNQGWHIEWTGCGAFTVAHGA